MTGWSRKSKAQPCTLVDLHHTSWQKTGTMINSAAPENEDRCLGLEMSAHFTASKIRFFWSCLLLPLVQGVLIVAVVRTEKRQKFKESVRRVVTVNGNTIEWFVCRQNKLTFHLTISLFFNHIFVIQENLVSRPHVNHMNLNEEISFFCYRWEQSKSLWNTGAQMYATCVPSAV